jgi:integrase
MQNTVSLKQVSHPRYEFRVRWHENGKDQQKWFAKGQKDAAKLFMQRKEIELGNHGTKHGTIADDERAALIIFRDAVAGMAEPRPSLLDCVNSYLASIANRVRPISVNELVALRAKAAESKGVGERTLRDLIGADGTKGRLGAFAGKFGKRQAASLTAEEIEGWLTDTCGTDANRREIMIRLHGLFEIGKKRRYLLENPMQRLELPRPNSARAHILTVTESARLLAECPQRTLPALAVQLFAGLRRAEAERLDWQDIDFDNSTIKVTQRKGTGARREKARFAPLLLALRAWLEPQRKLAGHIFPSGRNNQASDQCYRDDFESARESANLATWDENTLRHTYGSHRVAAINDLERVKVEMGHTTSRTTSEHYVNAVRPKDAESFWNLRPQTEPTNVTTMKRKSA